MQARTKNQRLINKRRLKAALENYFERNVLITEIDKLAKNAPQKFEKSALIFWLGNNTSCEQLGEDQDFLRLAKCLYVGYYVSLILDKHINTVSMSPGHVLLAKCRSSIFQYYNNHYELLRSDPEALFKQFQHFIENINTATLSYDEQIYVATVQALCINELKRIIDGANPEEAPVKFDSPLPDSIATTGDSVSLSLITNGYYTAWLNKIISRGTSKLHPFFANRVNPDSTKFPHARKMFLPAKDGTILEGLYVAKSKHPSKGITLALVGHFQAEHQYFGNSYDLSQFSNTFGNDVVFVNHRNFSIRANKLANSIDEIASDCAWFAKYFLHHNHDVYLYGMCGGAPHAVLAARELSSEGRPYKLILDRTFKSYRNIFSYSNVSRSTALYDIITYNKSWTRYFENHALVFAKSFVLQSIFTTSAQYTGTDYSFAEVALSLPEENVLVLQAKSKKRAESSFPASTDGVVAPHNDMRHAFKARRKHQKEVFKKLLDLALNMMQIPLEQSTQKLFQDLHVVFTHCLKLIEDEKLQTRYSHGNLTRDIHSYKLFELDTRNRMAISTFIQGFFATMPENWRKQFDAIKTYPDTNNHALYNAIKTKDISDMTAKLIKFKFLYILKLIHDNKDLIARMSFRVKASGLYYNYDVFNDLINSDFHRMIPEDDTATFSRRC